MSVCSDSAPLNAAIIFGIAATWARNDHENRLLETRSIAQTLSSCAAGMLPVVEHERVIGGVSLPFLGFLIVFHHRAAAFAERKRTEHA